MGLSQFSHEKLWKYWETAFFDQRKKRLKITKENLTPHPVLWTRGAVPILTGSGYRLRITTFL